MRIAVAESHLTPAKPNRLSLRRYAFDLIDDFFELGTIRSRVHEQRPADTAGNALGKFQTRIPFARRFANQLRYSVGCADIHMDPCSFFLPFDFFEFAG